MHTTEMAPKVVVNKILDPRIANQMRKGMRLTIDSTYYGGPVEMGSAYVFTVVT